MSKRLRLLAVLLVIPMLVVTASNVFAANKYNIDYFPTSGAEELTNTNVVVDENAKGDIGDQLRSAGFECYPIF